jgi:hypothetical protein
MVRLGRKSLTHALTLTYLQGGDDILLDPVPDTLVLGRAVVLLAAGNGHADVARVDLTPQLLTQHLTHI